ncbi:hypothetical protein [Salinimicrobium sp. TH3]|nr:hypothetical protein [Salinimicrobium sp. TH3]MCY2688436.1 hypothetical protein [Salinimicrobium sp. TH3]
MHEILNHRKPREKAQLAYKNELAKLDLGIHFRPVKETLNNYST